MRTGRRGDNDNRWEDEANSYDCWIVGYRQGAKVFVSAKLNIHEVLFAADRVTKRDISDMRIVFFNQWCGQRHRKSDTNARLCV
jgi:hypothetical protein